MLSSGTVFVVLLIEFGENWENKLAPGIPNIA